MFCIKCGIPLDDEVFFCPNCGTALHRNDNYVNEIVNPPVDNMPAKSTSKKKKIIVATIAALLICIGIVFHYGFSGNKIIGEWVDSNNEMFFSFYKDNTGEVASDFGFAVKFTWHYNQTDNTLTLDMDLFNSLGEFELKFENDTLIAPDGTIFHRIGK